MITRVPQQPSVQPCPAWCAKPSGHEYDLINPTGNPVRHHTAKVEGPFDSGVEIAAKAVLVGDLELIEQPVMRIVIAGETSTVPVTTPDQAQALAVTLYGAADRFARILGGVA